MNKFDSTTSTLKHIKRVNELLLGVSKIFIDRAIKHDLSALSSPEKEGKDLLTPEFRKLKYGSKEYFDVINNPIVKASSEHHHANNSHHVEYYIDGIMGMDLFDITEMLVDWKAATERNEGADFNESLSYNFYRFNIPTDIQRIMSNTAKKLNFII